VHQELPQGKHPGKPRLVAVGDVEIKGHLLFFAVLLDLLDGVSDTHLVVQGHEVGGHQAAGRIGVVLEQLVDLLPIRFFHALADFVGNLLGQRFQDVRGVVLVHLLDDGDHVLGSQSLDQVNHDRLVELAQKLADDGGLRDDVENVAAFFRGKMAENDGEIGRMGLVDQLEEVIDGIATVQAADGIEDNHRFVADEFSFQGNIHALIPYCAPR